MLTPQNSLQFLSLFSDGPANLVKSSIWPHLFSLIISIFNSVLFHSINYMNHESPTPHLSYSSQYHVKFCIKTFQLSLLSTPPFYFLTSHSRTSMPTSLMSTSRIEFLDCSYRSIRLSLLSNFYESRHLKKSRSNITYLSTNIAFSYKYHMFRN